ncbi:MAG: LamG domain-containing protein [Planctomycetes bacterium]|nr:LamG domain-containing protein [Planctomycetota bacterium]
MAEKKIILAMDSDFSDSGPGSHSPSVNGATIDTTVKKIGAGSGKFVASSSQYVSYADSPDWAFGSDNFIIKLYLYRNSTGSTQYIAGQSDSASNASWLLSFQADNTFRFGFADPTVTVYDVVSTTVFSSTGVWSDKITIRRDFDTLRLFVGDTQEDTEDVTGVSIRVKNNELALGRMGELDALYFDGNIDEFEIIEGTLATSSFNQRYALTAPTLIESSLNQSYVLDAPTLYKAVLNQRYALAGAALKTSTLNQRYALSGATLNLTSLNQLWALVAPTGPHLMSLNQRYILDGFHLPFTLYYAVTYTLTLTGAPDSLTDIILPMSSFQSRLKDGDPSWLSVVVPNGRTYADSVAARPNGEIVIDRNGIKEDGSLESIEIGRVALEEIRTDEGGRSSALTLSGHKTTSSSTPKGVALDKVKVRSEHKGKRNVQIAMDSAIEPGDQAEMDGQIFTIGEITRYVNSGSTQMTVKEK